MTPRQVLIAALLTVGLAVPVTPAQAAPAAPATKASAPAGAGTGAAKASAPADARAGAAKASAPAAARAGAAKASAPAAAHAVSGKGAASARTLEDIHIEGEIPVPQVLFITTRDQRRFVGFQHRRYLRTSRKIGEDTVVPSRIMVTGAATLPERSRSDD